jgi:pyruvate kinase
MPFICEQDRSDIEFGCKLGFDYIACSFTRTAEDILEIRKILDKNASKMKVIAKIESTQGVKNIEEILDVVDGVMVARGDLGVEVPMEDVPVIRNASSSWRRERENRHHGDADAGFDDA